MKSFMHGCAAAAALVGLLCAQPALADATSDQYRSCDGYGAASNEGDGMTSYATVLFIFSPPDWGNTARSAASIGQAGIADCNAALSDLPGRHWMRKISLLRARAIHYLQAGDIPAAMADLDSAEALGQDDFFYTRSLGLGLKLTRAYAARLAGDLATANKLAGEAIRARPYNRQVNVAAMLALGSEGDGELRHTAMANLYRLFPDMAPYLYDQSFELNRFDEVDALYPRMPANSTSPNAYVQQAGMEAYALAALGRDSDALALLDATKAKLATMGTASRASSAPQDNDADPAEQEDEGEDSHRAPSPAAPPAERFLDSWRMLVNWRLQISQGHAADVLKAIQKTRLPPSGASLDLVKALAAALPPKLQALVPKAPAVYAPTSKNEEGRLLDTFFKSLPGPETAHNIPDFSDKGWLDTHGVTVTEEGDRTHISFHGSRGTPTVTEEITLLKATELARDAGKSGIVVTSRHDTQYSVTMTYYGMALRTDPDGFSTDLVVEFVDPAALPDDVAKTPWRVMDANAILGDLEPIYRPGKKAR